MCCKNLPIILKLFFYEYWRISNNVTHTTSRLGMEIDAALENDGRGKFLMR